MLGISTTARVCHVIYGARKTDYENNVKRAIASHISGDEDSDLRAKRYINSCKYVHD